MDGANLGAEDTTAPYSIPWNTTGKSNGSHTLTAVARDALGLQFQSQPVTVTVSNAPPPDTTPPSVSITSPASGATVSGTTAVTASASDNVGVAGVQFFVDGSALGSEDTAAPYSASWDTTTVANGSHSLTATARDAAGNSRTSTAVTVTVTRGGPPSTTRFEESAAILTPGDAWSATSSAGSGATLSGDRGVFSATSGARASFTFSGTGVSWIGLPCEICGFSNIFLDGALVGTVDTFAATRPAASRALFTAGGLTATSHTLVIEVTGTQNASSGGANVVVDAFDVEGATGGGTGPTRVEETDPSVTYAGTWITQFRPDLSGGSVVESAEPDGTASLTFDGTGVGWIGVKGPWAGIAEVYIDGTLAATVDTYAPTEQAQAVMYTAVGLPPGTHTVRIRVTGTWSSSSSSAWVVVDAFDVESP
ncbi:MAG: Ig-like domain-containing protein [Acidobacteria bacterium]|nr:Ig-like domain-containing protein [Acidobacteriota bacterium]